MTWLTTFVSIRPQTSRIRLATVDVYECSPGPCEPGDRPCSWVFGASVSRDDGAVLVRLADLPPDLDGIPRDVAGNGKSRQQVSVAPTSKQNHQTRCEHAKVRNDVGARANPAGAQMDFASPVLCEHPEDGDVHAERQQRKRHHRSRRAAHCRKENVV